MRRSSAPLNLDYERMHGWPSQTIAGVDEAGRGAWAGPVIAAAVICPPSLCPDRGIWPLLRDSKLLTPEQRQQLSAAIYQHCIYAIGCASVHDIDQHNILRASLLAMARALARLVQKPDLALVDGRDMPDTDVPAQALVQGDRKVFSIAAASIMAKTHRDNVMQHLDRQHPAYGWARNKGYGTLTHRQGLQQAGISRQHRRSFAPITKMICG